MIPYRKLRARIERDKAQKEERRQRIREESDRLENVFTARHYIEALQKCQAGTSRKASVQQYKSRALSKIHEAWEQTLAGNAPPISTSHKVVIRERGKERIITPIRIADRVVQRVLCDYALVPIMESRLIYDNSASRKDMGVDFARRRFNVMLERAKAKWGNDFYALSFDFKSYFDSIPHRLCMEELDASFRDKRITDISMQVIESYQKRDAMLSGDTELLERLNRHDGVGICLGSQVSQIMALAAPNKIDHYLKDVLGIQEVIRYMDDGQILHQDKNYLKAVLTKLEEMAKSCGLRLNPKKTRITHIRYGITFLKIRYTVRGMKTIRKMVKAGKVRMQKKLKKLVHFVRDRVLDAMDVYASLQSWAEHASRAMSFHTRRRMAILYDQLYRALPGYRRYALT